MLSQTLARRVLALFLGPIFLLVQAGPPAGCEEPTSPSLRTIVVAADGSGDFETVQAAIDSVPTDNAERVTIEIRPGTYKELVTVSSDKPFIALRGQDAKTTILTYDNFASKTNPETGENYGTSGSSSTFIKGDDFTAENLTFENSAGRVGQAVAIRITAERCTFLKCRFLGWQDTLYAKSGRQYYKDCYIEGNCDFIFGEARAVFDRCEVVTKDGGYYTAQSRKTEDHYSGYVFTRCRLTGKNPVYLGRPWRDYSTVVYLDCWMDECVRPEGWDNWRSPDKEKTAYYAEYKSTGPGANPEARVQWSHQLTEDEAARFATAKFLQTAEGETDDWLRGVVETAKAE
ncbi:pectin esterase [Candidatus Sumerlaeota bacterium]|nr:pectin esterase [Candidatus Sumerlaeota bacterium]